jgi:hypothetical protein
MRPTISDPTLITPALLATTIWPRSSKARYGWRSLPTRRDSRFHCWRQGSCCPVISCQCGKSDERRRECDCLRGPTTAMAGGRDHSLSRTEGRRATMPKKGGAVFPEIQCANLSRGNHAPNKGGCPAKPGRRLIYLSNTSQAIIAHTEMLMARAWIHGHGDEYRRPGARRAFVTITPSA